MSEVSILCHTHATSGSGTRTQQAGRDNFKINNRIPLLSLTRFWESFPLFKMTSDFSDIVSLCSMVFAISADERVTFLKRIFVCSVFLAKETLSFLFLSFYRTVSFSWFAIVCFCPAASFVMDFSSSEKNERDKLF